MTLHGPDPCSDYQRQGRQGLGGTAFPPRERRPSFTPPLGPFSTSVWNTKRQKWGGLNFVNGFVVHLICYIWYYIYIVMYFNRCAVDYCTLEIDTQIDIIYTYLDIYNIYIIILLQVQRLCIWYVFLMPANQSDQSVMIHVSQAEVTSFHFRRIRWNLMMAWLL